MAKRKCVLSETPTRSFLCLRTPAKSPRTQPLPHFPALAAAPEVLASRHRPPPTGPAPRTKAGPQEALTSFRRKGGTLTSFQSKNFIECSLRLSKQEGPRRTRLGSHRRTDLARAKEEGPHPHLSRRFLPFHAAFPSLKVRPDCPSGESERPHLPVSGEARAGRGSPGTGLARTRGQLWAPRRAAPSSSLLPPPESPQSPSAWRFLILGNFLNAPRQAPHFLPAAALHRPGTAPQPLRRERPVCHVRPQRPGQGSGGWSAPEPSPRGWPTRREAGGEKREEPGGRSLTIPGRRRPGQGGLIAKKGRAANNRSLLPPGLPAA